MNYSSQVPDIYFEIIKYFPKVNWEEGIAITYGDTVYSKNILRQDVAAHEEIHVYQQKKIGPALWWKKYLSDHKFRLQEETEAYKHQVIFINAVVKDRNLKFRMIRQLALHLSSPIYGNMCTFEEARNAIK